MDISLKNDVGPFVHLLDELLTSLYYDAVRELDSISETTAQMGDHIKELSSGDFSDDLKELKNNCDQLIMKSQFADRISQRIDNTRKIVELLGNLLDHEFDKDLLDWYATMEKIRGSFTMEQEHDILEKVFDFSKLIDSVSDENDDDDLCTY